MISGVNDFHPSKKYSSNLNKKVSVLSLINKYSKVYSLVQNTRRSKNLNIDIKCDEKLSLSFGGNVIEYIISMLFDNIWKYSVDGSSPKIIVYENDNNLLNIKLINQSKPITECQCLFEKGFQEDVKSEGFGYGLFWATLLVSHYNELSGLELEDDYLVITHEQNQLDDGMAEQIFTLKNILL